MRNLCNLRSVLNITWQLKENLLHVAVKRKAKRVSCLHGYVQYLLFVSLPYSLPGFIGFSFVRMPIVGNPFKVPKRTAIQETVLDAVRSYNEVIEIAGKSTVRTVYALPKFTIPDDKLLLVELYEKNGGRHQVIRVENADIVNAEVINELKIK